MVWGANYWLYCEMRTTLSSVPTSGNGWQYNQSLPTSHQDLSIGCNPLSSIHNFTFLQFVFTRKSWMNAFPTTSHRQRSSIPWTPAPLYLYAGGVGGAIPVFVGQFLHLRELWSLLVSYFCAWFIGWCFCCSTACTTFITKIWHFNVERDRSPSPSRS